MITFVMMKKIIFLSILILCCASCGKKEQSYMGSRSCRECHENFYELWETSYHGRAMQNFTAAFADENLSPCDTFIRSSDEYFSFVRKNGEGVMITPGGDSYPVRFVLGGKYVYYFLTPMDGGKLQTLPLGYDVEKEVWFDITASSIRLHQTESDEPLPWTDRRYTFNTACFSCHVSQLSSEYNIKEDSYKTTWKEAGINCETCHGPAEKHNREFQKAEKSGKEPDEMYLKTVMQSRGYTAEQVNASCSYCHAKMLSLTPEYIPGEEFFRHFDLVTYENPDYYPDGRDLGENYTYTSWRMSPCVQNSDMDCMHCHTSSGRYRQKEDPNASCLPCHSQQVEHATEHTRHPEGSPGNICINCHLPKTEFARMTRSDHSMRPPMPAATAAYGSPNACNLCHTDKSTVWADSVLLKRYTGRFQSETMEWAEYIHTLRQGNDEKLGSALQYLRGSANEIVRSSIIRCLDTFRDERIVPVMLELLDDPSPLVRSSAATTLQSYLSTRVTEALCRVTRDPVLLVRIRAAASLAELPPDAIPPEYRGDLRNALRELRRSLQLFPDSEISHYNFAIFLEKRDKPDSAVSVYRRALKLRPEYNEAAVNLAMLYYENAEIDSALYLLRNAVNNNPREPETRLNLAMLNAETGNIRSAVRGFRTAYRLRENAVAAYNLAVLYSGENPDSCLYWAEKAYDLQSGDPKYLYSYAFYLSENGRTGEAQALLEKAVKNKNTSFDIYYLLGSIYANAGKKKEQRELFKAALKDPHISERERGFFRENGRR